MFANVSNHPVPVWPAAQCRAAEAIARPIVDFAFPPVDPAATESDVAELARRVADSVIAAGATAAMVEGEFTLTYSVVRLLQRAGVRCYAATSARMASDSPLDGGRVARHSVYSFVGFREYGEAG